MCSRRTGSHKKITILFSTTQRIDTYGESGPLPALAGVLLFFQSHAGRARGDD